MINRIIKLIDENDTTYNKVTIDLGLCENLIADWERGISKPSIDAIIKIARYFNVSTDYILTGKVNQILLNEFKDIDSDIINENSVLNNNKLNFKYLPIIGETIKNTSINILNVCKRSYIEVPRYFAADYAFFQNDDSMSPQVKINDLIFVKAMPLVESDSFIVVEIDGVLTCKKIVISNNKIIFISINDNYKPFIFLENIIETEGYAETSKQISYPGMIKIKSYKIIGKVHVCLDKSLNFYAV